MNSNSMTTTMMHMPMTVQMIMRHGLSVFPDSRVGTFDGETLHYKSYAEIGLEAAKLATALQSLGITPGDRVGTFSWNNNAHMAGGDTFRQAVAINDEQVLQRIQQRYHRLEHR